MHRRSPSHREDLSGKKAFSASLLILAGLMIVATPALADDVVDGQTGSGALYRLVRPTLWNGDLVLYAHGYVSPEAPIALPSEAPTVVGLLVPQGYAVAFSSYSKNG